MRAPGSLVLRPNEIRCQSATGKKEARTEDTEVTEVTEVLGNLLDDRLREVIRRSLGICKALAVYKLFSRNPP
jgi:hypothetical protein